MKTSNFISKNISFQTRNKWILFTNITDAYYIDWYSALLFSPIVNWKWALTLSWNKAEYSDMVLITKCKNYLIFGYNFVCLVDPMYDLKLIRSMITRKLRIFHDCLGKILIQKRLKKIKKWFFLQGKICQFFGAKKCGGTKKGSINDPKENVLEWFSPAWLFFGKYRRKRSPFCEGEKIWIPIRAGRSRSPSEWLAISLGKNPQLRFSDTFHSKELHHVERNLGIFKSSKDGTARKLKKWFLAYKIVNWNNNNNNNILSLDQGLSKSPKFMEKYISVVPSIQRFTRQIFFCYSLESQSFKAGKKCRKRDKRVFTVLKGKEETQKRKTLECSKWMVRNLDIYRRWRSDLKVEEPLSSMNSDRAKMFYARDFGLKGYPFEQKQKVIWIVEF